MPLLFIKKSLSSTKCQYTLFYFLIAVLIQISTVNAADNIKVVELSSLGHFDTSFSEVKKVDNIKGQSLIGEIGYMAGENYSVTFPFDVQQITYRVKNGSVVKQGELIALVEGYDVHHFIDEYETTKVLLEIQQKHFQTNKQYFENKTIKSSQWIEITKSYYEAKLNFEHIQHQMSFLHIDENEQITIISPKEGVIQIPSLMGSKVAGELAFDIVDKKSINVKIIVPLLLASNLSYFDVNSTCRLNIKNIEEIADKFHQIVWAESASMGCKLILGQVIKVTPIQNIDGYKIAKTAIFEFENKNYIALKGKKSLSLIPIDLMGTSEGEYIFTTKADIEDIEGKQGLISSVSILQGNLLSLGAE
ncbi:MAG: hypothetical protein COA59_05055 [Colwellia sp.]|nr:MAG: hypothetical protein COA59_05055 [Colwellia sp.]